MVITDFHTLNLSDFVNLPFIGFIDSSKNKYDVFNIKHEKSIKHKGFISVNINLSTTLFDLYLDYQTYKLLKQYKNTKMYETILNSILSDYTIYYILKSTPITYKNKKLQKDYIKNQMILHYKIVKNDN